MKEHFLAQCARQLCAPAPLTVDIGDPNTYGPAERAINDKASGASTSDSDISSSDNDSEEEGVAMAWWRTR
jgi:hypothetical protein